MQFHNQKTPIARTGGATGTAAELKRPLELTMYKELPSGEVSVEEFEKYALDRLRGKTQLMHAAEAGAQLLSCAPAAGGNEQHSTHVLTCSVAVCAVLKAIEEAKLRGKNDDVIQVQLHQAVCDKHP
jgi:hypothetical protein